MPWIPITSIKKQKPLSAKMTKAFLLTLTKKTQIRAFEKKEIAENIQRYEKNYAITNLRAYYFMPDFVKYEHKLKNRRH